MIVKLTEKDIKILEQKKVKGYTFAIIFLSLGLLFNLIYFLLAKEELNYFLLLTLDAGIILLSWFICYFLNKDLNSDLKGNEKEIIKKTVEKKIMAGGNTKYLILVNGKQYKIDKLFFDSINEGETICFHFSKHSDTVLGFSKAEYI